MLESTRASRIAGKTEGSGHSHVHSAHKKVRHVLAGDGGDRGNIPCLAKKPVSHSLEHIQIFTGRFPFYPYSDEQVLLILERDRRPDKPAHGEFTSKMWTLTKKCWNKNPKKRPDILDVLRKLESRDGAFSNTHPGYCLLLREFTGNNNYTFLSDSLSALFNSRISPRLGERLDTNRPG